MHTNIHRIMGDERGKLVAIEEGVNIPFKISRVFYIYGTQPTVPRGNHAHYKTKQYLIAVNGSCKVELDDGKRKEVFLMDQPHIGLFQDAMIWGRMFDFSDDCVLLVLADQHYHEEDYIRSYGEFKFQVSS